MRKLFAIVLTLLVLPLQQGMASAYSQVLCISEDYDCLHVKSGESWQSLWPIEAQRDIVQRLNRINTRLHSGMVLAVPKNLLEIDAMTIAPLPRDIGPQDQNVIIVEPKKLAWGAYDSSGKLIKWGPASLGKDYCPDVGRRCHSPTGNFTIYAKGSEDCVSTKFPVGRGGAPMPYCMFFHGGFALHGSYEVPGYHASHGCIRIFPRDAQWLNQEFISLPHEGGGTKVIVHSYDAVSL